MVSRCETTLKTENLKDIVAVRRSENSGVAIVSITGSNCKHTISTGGCSGKSDDFPRSSIERVPLWGIGRSRYLSQDRLTLTLLGQAARVGLKCCRAQWLPITQRMEVRSHLPVLMQVNKDNMQVNKDNGALRDRVHQLGQDPTLSPPVLAAKGRLVTCRI